MKTLSILSGGAFIAAAIYLGVALSGNSSSTSAQQAGPDVQTAEFDSPAQASNYAGFQLKMPTDQDWSFSNARISKQATKSGELVQADVSFGNPSVGSIFLREINAIVPASVASGNPQPVDIQGTKGTLDRGGSTNPNLVVISWSLGGMTYHARSFLSPGFSLDDLIRVLESVK